MKRTAFFTELAQDVFGDPEAPGYEVSKRLIDELVLAVYAPGEEPEDPQVPYYEKALMAQTHTDHLSQSCSNLTAERAGRTAYLEQLEQEKTHEKQRADGLEQELLSLRAKFNTVRSLYEEVQDDYQVVVAQLSVHEKILEARRDLCRSEYSGASAGGKIGFERKRVKQEDHSLDQAADKALGKVHDPTDNGSVPWKLAAAILAENFAERGATVRKRLQAAPSFHNGSLSIQDIPGCIAMLGIVVDPNEFALLAMMLDTKGTGKVDVMSLQGLVEEIVKG
eukprot:TRINITY_DN3246_c0_g1_i2.p1 TRINITY_DN3246_c0_g1~~TRINITY_DN3246_c0_g1_i2.p1  ORF type:complete len:280 (-),score=69.09 TRINITY_DN3246_c0_g1_i2:525-1364(-)